MIAFLQKVYSFLLSLRYRLHVHGTELLTQKGPKLFLSNHQALVDPQILVAYLYAYGIVAPVISASYRRIPGLRWFFRLIRAIPVPDLHKGLRQPQVLNTIIEASLTELRQGNSVLLYPSGRLTADGREKIGNAQIAYELVKVLPQETRIIMVTISGLWGSMWSKARSRKTPSLAACFIKALFLLLVHGVFFMPRRNVHILFCDMTEELQLQAYKHRRDFNRWMEDYYQTVLSNR